MYVTDCGPALKRPSLADLKGSCSIRHVKGRRFCNILQSVNAYCEWQISTTDLTTGDLAENAARRPEGHSRVMAAA